MRRGFLTNLLNPKVGVFYVSFLPQFLPDGVPAGPFIFLLAALHALMGLAWFALLIAATRPIAGALQRAAVVRWLDRVTGGVFLGFGLRLALERR
jgi:threonine/homoserine/homoserine lactone efflux protein